MLDASQKAVFRSACGLSAHARLWNMCNISYASASGPRNPCPSASCLRFDNLYADDFFRRPPELWSVAALRTQTDSVMDIPFIYMRFSEISFRAVE